MKISKRTWTEVFLRDRGCCRYCATDLLHSVSAFCGAALDCPRDGQTAAVDDPADKVLVCAACASLLARVPQLRSFEERRAFLTQQRTKGQPSFEAFRMQLRQAKSTAENEP